MVKIKFGICSQCGRLGRLYYKVKICSTCRKIRYKLNRSYAHARANSHDKLDKITRTYRLTPKGLKSVSKVRKWYELRHKDEFIKDLDRYCAERGIDEEEIPKRLSFLLEHNELRADCEKGYYDMEALAEKGIVEEVFGL